MKLRAMGVSDAESVGALARELGYPASALEMGTRIASLDETRNGVFVAEGDGGRLLGWVHVAIRDCLLSPRRAEIVGLVVTEPSRGLGIGRSLVEQAEEWARDREVGLVRVASSLQREGSHPFYQRLGYALKKTSAVYEKKVGDVPS